MAVIVLKSGEPLSYSKLSPPTLSQLDIIKDYYTDEQLTTNDMHEIFMMYRNDQYIEREMVLNIIDEYYLFTPEKNIENKVYALAFYIEKLFNLKNKNKIEILESDFKSIAGNAKDNNEIDYLIENLSKTCDYMINNANYNICIKKINEILKEDVKSPIFTSLKGYYFLFLNDIDKANFLFKQNHNKISQFGLNICKNNELDDNKNKIFKMFSDKYYCMENIIEKIMIISEDIKNNKILVESTFIRKFIGITEKFEKFFQNDKFNSILNYFIAKIYHLRHDYILASEFYKKSNVTSAINNYMVITRKIIIEDDIFQNILNYIYLINNETEKITLDETDKEFFSIYKAKKEENWCGSALISYFYLTYNNNIDKAIVYCNLVYFFIKCLEEEEIESIKKFYDLIQESENFKKSKNQSLKLESFSFLVKKSQEVFSNENSRIIIDCFTYLIEKIQIFDDEICKYNLSFLLNQKNAINLLESLIFKSAQTKTQIAFLYNDINFYKSNVVSKDYVGNALLGNLFFSINKTNEALEIFNNFIDDLNCQKEISIFAFLMISKINLENFFLSNDYKYLDLCKQILVEGLKRHKNSFYIAISTAEILFYDEKYKEVIFLCNKILKDIKRFKTPFYKKAQVFLYQMVFFSNLKLKLYDECFKITENVKNVELIEHFYALYKQN
ncbi:hypothetical protein GVAV_003113 [Gurleya vavrai]